MASHVVGANLEFNIGEISFSFLYDLKDRLVDFSISGSDAEDVSLYQNFFSKLTLQNRFQAIEKFKSEASSQRFKLFPVISKILFEFNPSFCDLSKSENTNLSNIICRCFGITNEEVSKIIDLGARDLTTITNLTKAGGGCSSCGNDIIQLIKEKTNLTLIPIEDEASAQTNIETQTKKAKLARQKIMNLWPLDFLDTYIFPMSKKFNFEVISLVENVIYIKADGAILELETFIRDNKLSLVTFYI